MIFPYLGEKTKFANFIVPKIPKDISIYVEPFGGAMGIFFSLDFDKFKNVKFIYNDINHLNYNLFNQLKNNSYFLEFIQPISVNEDLYKKALDYINTGEDTITLAINWLIILTCSSPYEIGKYSWRNSDEFEIFKIKFHFYKERLFNLSEIYNLDYKEVIKRYDSESTFFYLDPPYKGKESYYINHNFNEESHKELADTLKEIKGRFLLSYYYFDGIEELYPDCKFESKKTIMGTEYLIMNY